MSVAPSAASRADRPGRSSSIKSSSSGRGPLASSARRWPFVGGSSGPGSSSNSSHASSTGPPETDQAGCSTTAIPKATYSLSRGGKDRPGTASTVDSFASALPFETIESSPRTKKVALHSPRNSQSSNSTGHLDLKELDFEELLASGETKRRSGTAEVARYDTARSTLEQRNEVMQGSGSSMMQRQPGIEEEEDGGEAVGQDEQEKADLKSGVDQRTPRLDSPPSPVVPRRSPLRPLQAALAEGQTKQKGGMSDDDDSSDNTRLKTPTLASSKKLPVHPLQRNAGSSSSSIHLDEQRTDSVCSNLASQTLATPPSQQRRSPSPASSQSHTSVDVKERSSSKARAQAVSNTSPGMHPNSSQITFTPSHQHGDPLHGGIDGGQPQFSDVITDGGNISGLKQRIKKTSGFLRRLGGGGSAEKSLLQPPRTNKIVRKASQSSLASEGGVSIANSTRSAPDAYQSRWTEKTSVPVPSIPSKFKGYSSKSPGKSRGSALKDGAQAIPSAIKGMPASDSGASLATSHTSKAHTRGTSSAGGSTGSASTEMRHALKAWEHEMEITLKQSGQDLESKMKIQKPLPHWTPSPRLPEYRMTRKRSFMEEGNDETVDASETLRSTTGTDDYTFRGEGLGTSPGHYTSTQHQQKSASLGLGIPYSGVFSANLIHSDPLRSSPTFASSPHHPSSDDAYHTRPSRDENASSASAMSFQTAIDRPSFFLRHAQGPVDGVGSKTVGSTIVTRRLDQADEAEGAVKDAETSIRFVASHSSETGEASSSTSYDGTAPSQMTSHGKDYTLTQADVPSSLPDTSLPVADSANEAPSQDLALRCWNEDESFKRKEKIAEWLGGQGALNESARRHYMNHFDFSGLRVDAAFRKLCDKLFLRAETQQVDRILSAFSQRYLDCNHQSSVFVNVDVIHALVFSMLLLNTDLHVADMQDRMTRNQFVRNTLAAILESSEGSNASPAVIAGSSSSRNNEVLPSQSSLNVSVEMPTSEQMPSTTPRPLLPSSHRPSHDGASTIGSDAARNAPFGKAWEVEMEGVLKDIYAAIRNDQIRLPINDSSGLTSLRAGKPTRGTSERVNALKRGSIRGIQGLLGPNSASVRSEDNLNRSLTSITSTQRSLISDHQSYSTHATSMASNSSYGLPPTLGFANTLSQSIIKESKDEEDRASIDSSNDDLTDDELALLGPPWAKEGMLTRKHYWEVPHKRAKDKSWTDSFVVVQKGILSMFKFGEGGASGGSSNAKGVGGGNWLSNATCIGEFPLAHTLANSLPPPGYNRSRPHVFALTLPSGSCYFFQTGHEELVQEWVSTCNYWAARQSREPLAGGVSNMEYGWNRILPVVADADESDAMSFAHSEHRMPQMNTNNSDTRSIRSGKSGKSLRMRVSHQGIFGGRPSMTGDSTGHGGSSMSSPVLSAVRGSSTMAASERPLFINEWRAPAPPTVSSTLSEEEQLEACKRHKARVEAELTEHNALRQPLLQYLHSTPGLASSTIAKATANFERKASYLLSDLTKFTLYAATLTSASKLKAEKRDARQLNRMMLKADEELSRIKEAEEGPPVPV